MMCDELAFPTDVGEGVVWGGVGGDPEKPFELVASRLRVGIELEKTEVDWTGAWDRDRSDAHDDPTILPCLRRAAFKALAGEGRRDRAGEIEMEFDDDRRLRRIRLDEQAQPVRAALTWPLPGYVLAVVWYEEDE